MKKNTQKQITQIFLQKFTTLTHSVTSADQFSNTGKQLNVIFLPLSREIQTFERQPILLLQLSVEFVSHLRF